MIKCSKCSKMFSKERYKLGYTICTACSNEERKVGHVVYPHKTGAYVQPVSSETAKRLNQLDRRGYKRQSGYSMPKSISSKKISHDHHTYKPSIPIKQPIKPLDNRQTSIRPRDSVRDINLLKNQTRLSSKKKINKNT